MAPSIVSKLRKQVLGYPVDLVDKPEILDAFDRAWKNDESLYIVTLNAEMIIQAQQDQRLDHIIRHADFVIPDGAGVVWALGLSGEKTKRLPGIDLAHAALQLAADQKAGVALLGGKEAVISKLLTLLPARYPGLKIVGSRDGYFNSDEEEEIVKTLSATKPKLLLVALGVPKQEYFIERWQSLFPNTVIIGVGGSFDVWAGLVKRAPRMWQSFHLEWLYRLLMEPWRFNRMSQALPKFAFAVMCDHIAGLVVLKNTAKKQGDK